MGGPRTSGTLTGTGERMERIAAAYMTTVFCFRDRSPRDRKNWDYKDKIRDKDVSTSYKISASNVFTIICSREETIIEEVVEEEEVGVTTILLLLVIGQSR